LLLIPPLAVGGFVGGAYLAGDLRDVALVVLGAVVESAERMNYVGLSV
jgi:hypothetical protein